MCGSLSESICLYVFAPSGGDDKILNIITGIYEFTRLPVSALVRCSAAAANTLRPLFSLAA